MSALAVPSVLTVEDDPYTRAELRLVLEDAGFHVCADASDGLQAVELARRHEPDVILLDLGLPRLDGVEVTRRILSEQDVPIVVLTGRSRSLVDRVVEAGAVSYVSKPFHVDDVVEALTEALQTRRGTQESAERRESREAIGELLALLGHPVEWAIELEERAFRAGRVWRRSPER
jgi:two-component system, response regulator PdtaR